MSEAGQKILDGLNQAVGYQQGQAAERAAIVAYLRAMASITNNVDAVLAYQYAAAAIERADHTPKEQRHEQ